MAQQPARLEYKVQEVIPYEGMQPGYRTIARFLLKFDMNEFMNMLAKYGQAGTTYVGSDRTHDLRTVVARQVP